MTEPTPATAKRKIVPAIAALLFGGYVFYAVATDDSNAEDHTPAGISRGEAWDDCKHAVTEKLNNPDSADFGLLSTDMAAQDGGGWHIAGSLKAENDFGVEKELGYTCEVSSTGKVKVTVS